MSSFPLSPPELLASENHCEITVFGDDESDVKNMGIVIFNNTYFLKLLF